MGAYRTPREGGGRRGKKSVYRGFVGETEGKRTLGNLGIDVRIIIRQTFKKWAVKARTGLIWLRIGASRERL